MRQLTCNFRLEGWEVSRYGMVNLDTMIFIEDSKLCHKPHFKPTSLGVPLSVGSCHSPQVHLGWTKAELNRMSTLSSSHEIFLYAKSTFLERLVNFKFPRCIIDSLKLHDPYISRLIRNCVGIDANRLHCANLHLHVQQPQGLILKLPFCHELYSCRIGSVARKFMEGPWRASLDDCEWLELPSKLRVAWLNMSKHLFLLVRHQQRLETGDGWRVRDVVDVFQ
jgi:hypothetical protein